MRSKLPPHSYRLLWVCGLVLIGVMVVTLSVGRWKRAELVENPGIGTADSGRGDSSFKAEQAAQSVAAKADQLPLQTKVSWTEIDDPSKDGWSSEVLADEAKKALYALVTQIFSGEISADAAEGICHKSFLGTSLIPEKSQAIFEDPVVEVLHWDSKSDPASPSSNYNGTAGFESMIRDAGRFWGPMTDKRFEIKIVRSLKRDSELTTRQLVGFSGRTDEKPIEQHAIWETRWQLQPNSDALRLLEIRVLDIETSKGRSSSPMFVDCAASILKGDESLESQLRFGLNHWLERIQDMRYFAPLGTPGVAVGDVNNDGRDDLYLCQEANLPNRLFLQQPDGSALEVAAAWDVDFLQGSRGVLLVDLDNDRDQDLVVGIMGGVVLAANEGNKFVVRNVLPTDDDTTSLTAADYDLDGDLDLYVCVDYPNDDALFADGEQNGITVQGGAANRVYHDANNAGRNSLFRNDITNDDWHFENVTEISGIGEANDRFSWAASWEDYDNDGDQDLYVSNDFGRNNLYVNQDGKFVNVADEFEIEDRAASMSVSWGDVNQDGQMDLYVANMFSSAGSRVTEQPNFMSDMGNSDKDRWRRFAMGNSLFANQGLDGFENVSQRSGATMGRWSWSSIFIDVNNDSWQDIFVANGYITSGTDKSDL
ncbi:MAG: VCBS repeat-containing protein [Planctomycetaceae bacterium]|nr:VCBS repeat-containing protein [Planctomycetaceae bacterium]